RTTSVIVDEFVLRRTREIKQWDMGIRHMNASSNAYRYYIMRNRGFIKQYYRAHGVYNPVLFALGSTATFFKELIRLVFVERTVRGTSNLFRGIRDGAKVGRDRSWQPMAPLEA
ncbi:glycosyl transferase, partial [Streptomyces sp. WAC 06725]